MSTTVEPAVQPTVQPTMLPPPVFPADWTMADLQDHLGGIPIERIRLYPPPGLATEDDVERIDAHEDRFCELIDGILVEKTVGYYESNLAMWIGHFLLTFVDAHKLGVVLGGDGTLRILPKQVRIPDACFISHGRFPGGKQPDEPIPGLVPDLAVEVLSKSNTRREMSRKLHDYFTAGVRLVWYVDPQQRTFTVYTAEDRYEVRGENDVVDGGDVLPGFQLPLAELFAKVFGG